VLSFRLANGLGHFAVIVVFVKLCKRAGMVLVDKPRRRVFFAYAANRMSSFLCSSNNVMFK